MSEPTTATVTVDVTEHPKRWLSLAGAVFGAVSGALGVGAMVWAFAIKSAAGTFVTRDDLAKERAAILHEVESRMDTDKQLVNQRLESLADKIDGLGRTVHDDGAKQQASIDRIYTLLIQRGGR